MLLIDNLKKSAEQASKAAEQEVGKAARQERLATREMLDKRRLP